MYKMSTVITFTNDQAASISDGNSLGFLIFLNATDSSDNSTPPIYVYSSSYNSTSYIVALSWTDTTSNGKYTAIINSIIISTANSIENKISATYTYTSSSITLSGLTINGISSSNITLVINGNTYTFTQSKSNSTTITYDSSTNSLTYSGNINQYALLMFGYVAILSGLYEDTIVELVGPAGMCQTNAYEMLGF